MANRQQIYNEIERSATRAHPDVSAEQALATYLRDHPAEYDRYLAARDHDPEPEWASEKLARYHAAAYPELDADAAAERFRAEHRRLYDQILFTNQEPSQQEIYEGMLEQAQAAYPDATPEQSFSRFTRTTLGEQLWRIWMAAGGETFPEPESNSVVGEQEFVAKARRAFPNLSEPEAVSRYLETPAGSTAYRALT